MVPQVCVSVIIDVDRATSLVQINTLCAVMYRTYLFPRFLDPEKAEHFVQLAKARLAPSSLAFKKGDTADNTRWAARLTTLQFMHSLP